MSKPEITKDGAILLGQNVVCDAHAKRPIRIVTHAHSDHLLGIEESLAECEEVVATPLTKDLIGVLKGRRIAESIKALDYGNTLEYEGGKITLYDANHIIGSAQVLLEEPSGRRVVYTGDFKLPGARIIPSDTLVMEATYGNPNHVRRFKESVGQEFVNLVKDSLNQGPVYIFGYHGKLQEVIRILNDFGVDAPVVVSEKMYKTVEICKKYGLKLRNCWASRSEEGRRIRKERHIGVYHMGASKWVGRGAVRIFLSGWEFEVPYRKAGEREYLVALSDHSDFEQLIEYVQKSKPSLVIADKYRVGNATSLAREIRARLGIEAIAMPEH